MQDQAAPPVVIAQPAETIERAAGFDLARLGRTELAQKPVVTLPRCNRNAQGEIVVCAMRPEEFLPKTHDPHDFAAKLDEGMGLAAVGLGDGVVLAAEVEQVDMGNGVVSNRVMVRLKLKQ
ncbi:hypothetical protein [Blastomonas sp.]|uniref:hypothetical protein n=1 Tax=Blastomonas sp. TaxID=1909299 RepID=UPI00260B4181|nr:hypothetical protein [Blastomonas sp.]MDM7956480.1 hypothetical protein [Blastomonas sp.]